MGKKTIVTKATTTSRSLRTTIPEAIVDAIAIKVGDALDWELVKVNGNPLIRIKKLE